MNISSATKAHCLQDFDGSLRTDVLYKTIIRDMRKFYSKDFNEVTQFIKRKRYRDSAFFFKCLRQYLSIRFPEVFTLNSSEDHSIPPERDFNDFVFFLGCLLYPRELKFNESLTKK